MWTGSRTSLPTGAKNRLGEHLPVCFPESRESTLLLWPSDTSINNAAETFGEAVKKSFARGRP